METSDSEVGVESVAQRTQLGAHHENNKAGAVAGLARWLRKLDPMDRTRIRGVLLVGTAVSFLSLARGADQADVLVRILWSPGGEQNIATGTVIPREHINQVLFIKEDCPLKIEDASKMGRAWIRTRYNPVCWLPLSDGSYMIVDQYGDRHWSKAEPFLVVHWEAIPHAMLHPDGSATITEPNFSGPNFWANVMAHRY
jgi:hypothetical protein